MNYKIVEVINQTESSNNTLEQQVARKSRWEPKGGKEERALSTNMHENCAG